MAAACRQRRLMRAPGSSGLLPRALLPLVVVVVGLLGACTGAQVGPPEDGPRTAAEVLARATARPVPQTLQGMARLDAYAKDTARKGDLLVRLKRPGSLQLQVLAPTLDLLALLNTDGKRFVSFERGGQQCHVGQACPRNLARLVPIALPPEQLVLALLGQPPLLDLPARELGWDAERGLYRVELGDAAGTWQQVFVAPRTFRFAGTILWQGKTRLVSIAYDGEIGRGGPPRRMRYLDPRQDLDVSVEMREVDLDEAIEDQEFAVQCPQGMAVVELPCQDVEAK